MIIIPQIKNYIFLLKKLKIKNSCHAFESSLPLRIKIFHIYIECYILSNCNFS